MKKLLCILLVLALCMSFAACGKDSDGGETEATETQKKELTLAEAAMNLAAAESYQVKFVFGHSYRETVDIHTYQVLRKDGKSQIRVNIEGAFPNELGGLTEQAHSFYYEDNTGYYIDLYTFPQNITKMISGENITMEQVLWQHSDVAGGTKFLTAFAGMSPQTVKGVDMTAYEKTLSQQEFVTLMNAICGYEAWAMSDFENMSKTRLEASAKMDSQGYLREMRLTCGMDSEEETVVVTIDKINQLQSVEVPSIVEEYESKGPTRVELCEGKLRSCYQFEQWSNNYFDDDGGVFEISRPGMGFVGFDDYDLEPGTVPVYEIPMEIDGVPVTWVSKIMADPFSAVTVERLVIPTGVVVQISGAYGEIGTHGEETTLFFHDTEDNVRKNFYVLGDPQIMEGSPVVKAAYYAGQWEYVNGIPTPNNP